MTDQIGGPEAVEDDTKPVDWGDVSDGFHTFRELYAHRTALFAFLCRSHRQRAWRSRQHHEGGEPMYPGFFIAGITLPGGLQITYHVADDSWHLFDGVLTREHAPVWDGHTPDDVIDRLNRSWLYTPEPPEADA